MLSFDDYKSKISIIQLLDDLGYKQDIKDGKVSPVFKLVDGKGNKLDEIVVKNPRSPQEHYFDRNYKGGDLIQFIKNHINDFTQFNHPNTFVKINMILSHYAKIPYTPKYESYQGNNNSKDITSRYKEISPRVSDLRFLTRERNLSPGTVETFLPFIKLVQDTQGKGEYKNIGFPYINPSNGDKVTNYELRNYNFKGMAAGGDKSNSVWVADFSPHPAMAKHIYFAESAIDAMSFYELNKSRIKLDECVFCSIGGYISNNQIINTLNKYPKGTVHTLFDNDLNGNIYDIKILGILSKNAINIREKNNNIEFTTAKGTFEIPKEQVSIERFREKAHINAPVQVHKSGDAKDFNEILQKKNSLKIKI